MVTYLIIAVLVIWSALYVFKKVFPQTAFKCFSKLADIAEAKGQAKLARWVRPAMPMGCGGGCGCSSDTSKTKTQNTVQAVKWK